MLLSFIKINILYTIFWFLYKFFILPNTLVSNQYIFILGSILIGSIYLIKQVTIKGVLASSSVVNIGIILFCFVTIINYIYFLPNIELASKLLIYVILYINIYIGLSLSIYILILYINKKSIKLNHYNKIYIQQLFYPLLKFKDNYLIVTLQILGGFPPFLLFILKFYLIYYTVFLGNLYISILILLLLNTFVLYGYIKFLSSLLIKLKYSIYTIRY